MKNIWDKWLRDILLLYCGLYTVATIVNSIKYLLMGIYEDPSGNWHELDRAVVTIIIVVAYALIKYVQIGNFFVKALAVYVPTMLVTFFYVFLRGFTDELAGTAYRDIFINYTVGFAVVAGAAFLIQSVIAKKK